MAVLAPQQINRTGLTPALTAAAAGGDEFQANPASIILIRNGSGASITATFVSPGTSNGLAVEDVVVTVPAGADRYVGSYSDDVFKNAQGRVPITYSAVASVTVAHLTIG